MPRKLTAVGCSIFAGLFTQGVKEAGFRVLAHLEQDSYGVEIAKLNHPELEVYDRGPASWPASFDPAPDLVYCNPPCAVWSAVGKSFFSSSGINWHEDGRLQHARDALGLVERYRPAVWVWESVPAALTRGRPMLVEMAREGRRHGYGCSILHFNARDLGVPQNRPRVMLVHHRVTFAPGPIHEVPERTPRDAWRGLPRRRSEYERLSRGEEAILPHVKPGEKLRRVFDARHGPEAERNERGYVKGRSPFPARRVHLDHPCPPMLQQLFHPVDDRHITVAEALRLCELPDDWRFPNGISPGQKLRFLQQSVMPGVGRWVAEAAARAIRRGEPADPSAPATVFDLREPEQMVYALEPTLGEPPWEESKADRRKSEARVAKPGGATHPRASREVRETSEAATAKAIRVCASEFGSGARIRKLVLQGRLNDDAIAETIRSEFPGRKTTRSDVAWNRGMLRKAGLLK